MPGKTRNKKAVSLDDYQLQYKKIGNQLRELRRQAGYTAALDFAYENEIPPAQYARYEAGSNMKLSSLIKVLSVHNLTLEEFFKGMS
jgi:transcriptional regulator with XRE-family HTH domain